MTDNILRITDDPFPALEGQFADVIVCATGIYHPDHRIITISQPRYQGDEDEDMVQFGKEHLPNLIAILQAVQAAYDNKTIL